MHWGTVTRLPLWTSQVPEDVLVSSTDQSSPAICSAMRPRTLRMEEAFLSGARPEWSYARPGAGSVSPEPAKPGPGQLPRYREAGTGWHRL